MNPIIIKQKDKQKIPSGRRDSYNLPSKLLIEMSSNRDDDNEALIEEQPQLLVINPIEASHNFSQSSSSSATPTVLARNSGHGHATNFPALKFGGRVLYSKTFNEVDERAMQLLKVLDTKRDESGKAIVGFDIEWRPSFWKGVLPGKVATVQICVDNDYCDVFHIFYTGIPQRLQDLIQDSTLVKVGIGIDGDSEKLFEDYGVSIKDFEDLSDLANKKIGGDTRRWGLASLTKKLVCKELLKPSRIRLGNWEYYPLSKEQLQYAATDAYASWHLYQVLKDLPDA